MTAQATSSKTSREPDQTVIADALASAKLEQQKMKESSGGASTAAEWNTPEGLTSLLDLTTHKVRS